MKWLIGIVIALFSAVGLAWLLREDAGYVLLTVGHWTIETSVAALLVFLLIGFFVAYKLVRYTGQLLRMPRTLAEAGKRRRERRAQRLLAKGTRDLAEGRWQAAEQAFAKALPIAADPGLYLAGAARAAQHLGARDRRDRYLAAAEKLPREAATVVGIARAEILLEEEQPEQAAEVLRKLNLLTPNRPRVLELQLDAASRLGDWEHALRLLPELRKRGALDEADYRDSQLQVARERLALVARKGTLSELQTLWGQIPKAVRANESLLIDYCGFLRDLNAADAAEKLLKQALSRQWSNALCVAFGQLGRGNAAGQLATAEAWLGAQKDNAYLHLTLGRLAARAHQLPKAKQYLEQSIRLQPMADAYQELGDVLEQMEDAGGAGACYRAGLRLLTGVEEAREGVALPAVKDLAEKPA